MKKLLIALCCFFALVSRASAVDFSNLENPQMTYGGYTYQHIVYGHYGSARYVLLTDTNAVYGTSYNSGTTWFHVYFNANHEIFFGGCDSNWQNCNTPYYGGDYGVYLDHSSYDFGVSVPVDITIPPPGPQLTAYMSPSGGGTVSSSPGGISCSAGNCQGSFEQDSEVTLTANPSVAHYFAYWDDGTNHITENPHVFTMDSEKTVTAVFHPNPSHDGNTYTDVIYGSNNGNYYIGLFNRTEIVLRTVTYSGGTLHFYSDRYYYGNLNDADIHAPLFGCTDNTFTNCTDYGDMVDFGVSNVIHSTYDFGLDVPVDMEFLTFRNAVGSFKQTSGYFGQCLDYVEYETEIPDEVCVGEAGDCFDQAQAAGYATGNIPREGSIVVFAKVPNTSLEYGHVGIVTNYDSLNNTITIHESNWCSNNCETVGEHVEILGSHAILGYIYYTP